MADIHTAIRRMVLLAALISITVFVAATSWTGSGPAISTEAATLPTQPDGGDAPAVTFLANPGTLGAIPDGGSPCPSTGLARDVTFTVSGFTGGVNTVEVRMSFVPAHTFAGDVTAILFAPNGANHILFGRTGATSGDAFGDSSDLSGYYLFTDFAVNQPSGGWWQEATVRGSTETLSDGSYRTTALGGAGQTNPAPFTALSAPFSGAAIPNGTWTLRLTDSCGSDTGSINYAELRINTGPQHIVDMNGDGRTDWSVVRNIGGGPGGQVAWFTVFSGVGGGQTDVFGSATDFFVPEDFDGDNKTDVAVWRPNAVAAFFYIMRSSTSTFQAIQWGITGDDPTVIGDYDGDGKADAVVYRAGASAGQQSFWHILQSSNGAYLPIQWGQNGDFVAPGDYDGDGRMDASVQRNAGGGSAIFFTRFFNGSFTQIVFGTPTDVVVPGDYDGDGKTDLAVVRGVSGQINWFYDPSSQPGTQIVQTIFGSSATDFPVQGDYDGDGRTDQAIWRPSALPGQSAFFVNGSSTGFFAFQHGQNGDYPVANYNSH